VIKTGICLPVLICYHDSAICELV